MSRQVGTTLYTYYLYIILSDRVKEFKICRNYFYVSITQIFYQTNITLLKMSMGNGESSYVSDRRPTITKRFLDFLEGLRFDIPSRDLTCAFKNEQLSMMNCCLGVIKSLPEPDG